MQTELFFLQAIPQNPKSGFRNDKLDSLVRDEPCRAGSTRARDSREAHNFQSTLKKLSHVQNGSDRSRSSDGSPSSGLKKCGFCSYPKQVLDGNAGLSENMAAENSTAQNNSDDGEVINSSAEELAAFWTLFRPLAGSKATPFDMPCMTDAMLSAEDTLSALKQATPGFQEQGTGPSVESMKEVIGFWRHFAQMTAGNDSLPTDVKLEEAQSLNQMPENAESGQKDVSDVRAVNGLFSQTDLTTNELGKSTAVESSGTMTHILQDGQSEQINVAKLVPEGSSVRTQPTEIQAAVATEDKSGSFQKAEAEVEKSSVVNLGKAAENQEGLDNQMLQNSRFEKESASQKLNSDARVGLENSTQRLSGDEPFAKVINESRAPQDSDVKMDKVLSDEQGIKVTKVDPPNNENGSLSSHHQSSDKIFETSSSSKNIETVYRDLSSQTIDQIVRRASIQLRNGHNEASIELKPEYLGHIRMQVSTENHQVTVRILAELLPVKEMIENNLHQLKADLQQQGLDVDKLEVSVSDYSEGHDRTHKNAHHMNPPGQKENEQETDTASEDEGRESHNSLITKDSAVTVDYFA